MERVEITEVVEKIIVDLLAVSADEVVPEARLIEDLNADSLDAVDLSLALEEKFDLTVQDDEVMRMLTVGDVIDFIQEKTA